MRAFNKNMKNKELKLAQTNSLVQLNDMEESDSDIYEWEQESQDDCAEKKVAFNKQGKNPEMTINNLAQQELEDNKERKHHTHHGKHGPKPAGKAAPKPAAKK